MSQRLRRVLGASVAVALVVALAAMVVMPSGFRLPHASVLAQSATPAASPSAADRLSDLQTQVAVLSTQVAELGGADPEAIAGRLGGHRA
ncbi:MAG TPA: hypothetical protein VFI22_10050, partial [Thermomicrobiales bacterium]|nr:hypothetical protein [Thermomicrobiales bacterium]